MQLATDGIVIREGKTGENDRLLTILTPKNGAIVARASGGKKARAQMGAATEFLDFAHFQLFSRNDFFYVDGAEPIELFYSLRKDLVKLSLASYFAQLTYFLTKAETETGDMLRLLLNTLYYLQTGERSDALLKAVFELRGLTLAGYMPDLTGCTQCGKLDALPLCFSTARGIVKCAECIAPHEKGYFRPLTPDVFAAMRHIAGSELPKVFRFRLSDENMMMLGAICEQYALDQLDMRVPTLDFYHTIK